MASLAAEIEYDGASSVSGYNVATLKTQHGTGPLSTRLEELRSAHGPTSEFARRILASYSKATLDDADPGYTLFVPVDDARVYDDAFNVDQFIVRGIKRPEQLHADDHYTDIAGNRVFTGVHSRAFSADAPIIIGDTRYTTLRFFGKHRRSNYVEYQLKSVSRAPTARADATKSAGHEHIIVVVRDGALELPETQRTFARAMASAIDLGAGSSDERLGALRYDGQPSLAPEPVVRRLSQRLSRRRDAGHTLTDMATRGVLVVELASSLLRMTHDAATERQFVESYVNPAVIVLAADHAMRALAAVQSMHSTMAQQDAGVVEREFAFDRVAGALDSLLAVAHVGLGMEPRRADRVLAIKQAVARSSGSADTARRLARERAPNAAPLVYVNALRSLKWLLARLGMQRFVIVGGQLISAMFVLEVAFWIYSAVTSKPANALMEGWSDGVSGGMVRVASSFAHTFAHTFAPASPPPATWDEQALALIQEALSTAGDATGDVYGMVREPVLAATAYTLGALASSGVSVVSSVAGLQTFVLGYLLFTYVWVPRATARHEREQSEKLAEQELQRQRTQAQLIGRSVATALAAQANGADGPRLVGA